MPVLEHAAIESAASDPRLVEPALRTFFNLATVWELRERDQRRLLGGISRGTWYAWRKHPPSSVSPDVMRRMSYLIGIHALLRQLFPDTPTAQMRERVRRVPPAPFTNDRSLLEFMLEGGIVAMHQVRSYLVSEVGAEITAPADVPALAIGAPPRW
jgi:hypothetical protein